MKDLTKKYSTNNVNVIITQVDGTDLTCQINIFGHDRLSSFLDDDKSDYLKCQNTSFTDPDHEQFIIIPKNTVLRYCMENKS